MDLNQKCLLSYYLPVAVINEDHGVQLVQHAETGKIFVHKKTRYYSRDIYSYLKANPIQGMPRIFELFEEDDVLHIIEEFIPGDTLGDLINSGNTFSEETVVSWAHQLCMIVARLHHCQPPIIHRDIKPSNIILTYDGRIVLLDLSAARQSFDSKSRDTIMMGTAGYAAPEQYGFSSSSEMTDIYSIGVLINKLLTGKLPNEQLYTGPLAAIIEKCTRLEPSARYGSIVQLDKELCGFNRGVNHTSSFKWEFLPPGFRSRNIPIMFFSCIGYSVLLFSILTMKTANSAPRYAWANRLSMLAAFLGIISFTGNYLNCQSYFPLSKSRNLFLKTVGIILWDFLILFTCALAGSLFR